MAMALQLPHNLTGDEAIVEPGRPASIEALVKIRGIVRRLRGKDRHSSATVALLDDAVETLEIAETFRLGPHHTEKQFNEFLAQVWAKYKHDGHTSIRFSHHDGTLTAHLSSSREQETIRLLTEQLAQIAAQFATYNEYLRAQGAAPAASIVLCGKEFSGA